MNNWKYSHPGKNIFTWLLIIMVIAGGASLVFFDKEYLFWSLNQQHSYPGDLFFRYFTHVGDGLFMIATGVVLLGLGKRKLGILILASFLLSGLFVQLFKRYKPEPRPGRYFSKIERIHKVEEQPLMGNNSFPSGHTTTAFAMFSMLALATRNYSLQFIYFLMALLVGYSRIYLGHHFFKDVYFGSLIGYGSTLFIYLVFKKREFGS